MAFTGKPHHDASFDTLKVNHNVVCSKSCVLNQAATKTLRVNGTVLDGSTCNLYGETIFAQNPDTVVNSKENNVLVYCQPQYLEEDIYVFLNALEPGRTQTVTVMRGDDWDKSAYIYVALGDENAIMFGGMNDDGTYNVQLYSEEDYVYLEDYNFGAIKFLGVGYEEGTIWYILNSDPWWLNNY